MAYSTSFTLPLFMASVPTNSFMLPTIPAPSLGFKRSRTSVQAISTQWHPSQVVPQADRVLVRLEELPEKSAGGVLLPKAAVKFERYLLGEVLSVGSEVDGIEPGKKVMFSDINAYEVELGSESKHCFCKAGDLLAVVE